MTKKPILEDISDRLPQIVGYYFRDFTQRLHTIPESISCLALNFLYALYQKKNLENWSDVLGEFPWTRLKAEATRTGRLSAAHLVDLRDYVYDVLGECAPGKERELTEALAQCIGEQQIDWKQILRYPHLLRILTALTENYQVESRKANAASIQKLLGYNQASLVQYWPEVFSPKASGFTPVQLKSWFAKSGVGESEILSWAGFRLENGSSGKSFELTSQPPLRPLSGRHGAGETPSAETRKDPYELSHQALELYYSTASRFAHSMISTVCNRALEDVLLGELDWELDKYKVYIDIRESFSGGFDVLRGFTFCGESLPNLVRDFRQPYMLQGQTTVYRLFDSLDLELPKQEEIYPFLVKMRKRIDSSVKSLILTVKEEFSRWTRRFLEATPKEKLEMRLKLREQAEKALKELIREAERSGIQLNQVL